MLTSRYLDLARIAPVIKFSDHSNLKILSPKEILQRLPIALAQVKADNTLENLPNKIRKLYIFCIEQKKLLKKHIII